MQTIGQTMGGTRMPSTLPIGSGNEDRLYSYSGHFYADSEADILAETTGAIGLETNTDG